MAAAAAFFVAGHAEAACRPRHYEMLYPVVRVESGGSGTVIYSAAREPGSFETYVLTNHHVAAAAIKVSEEWEPEAGKKVERESREPVVVAWFQYNDCSRSVGQLSKRARIVAYDRPADLALIRIDDQETSVPYVARVMPVGDRMQLMDEVWAVGAGLGVPPFATRGELAHMETQIDGQPDMMSTAPIIWGNSGGALFRRSEERGRYELVGVLSRVTGNGFIVIPHMAWSIPIATVRRFLEESGHGFMKRDDPSATHPPDSEAEPNVGGDPRGGGARVS